MLTMEFSPDRARIGAPSRNCRHWLLVEGEFQSILSPFRLLALSYPKPVPACAAIHGQAALAWD